MNLLKEIADLDRIRIKLQKEFMEETKWAESKEEVSSSKDTLQRNKDRQERKGSLKSLGDALNKGNVKLLWE